MQSIPVVIVKVANREVLQCDIIVPGLNWWIQGITFSTDMRVVDLGAYDAMLRIDWLQPFSLVNCHWQNKTLSFEYEGKQVCIQGVQTKRQATLHELSLEQLQKWCMGNEIWSFAVVGQQPQCTQEQTTAMPVTV